MMILYARIFPLELAIPLGADDVPHTRGRGRRARVRRRFATPLLLGALA